MSEFQREFSYDVRKEPVALNLIERKEKSAIVFLVTLILAIIGSTALWPGWWVVAATSINDFPYAWRWLIGHGVGQAWEATLSFLGFFLGTIIPWCFLFASLVGVVVTAVLWWDN